jgi:radical SAM superfamily enzyme YgiQ (UPF0313 family)
MKILFVATRKNSRPEDRELYEMDFMNELLGFKRSLLDLGILTVAACTPRDVAVQVVDEYTEPIPYDTDADLIALSAKTSCVTHAYEVAAKYRAKGKKVVLGGIHASLRPQEALEHVDYVVVGEAEQSWPQFVEAFKKGEAPRITNTTSFPPMDQVPVPAWDRIKADEFLFHEIQTTRGCPFTCRFCSVPDISGSSFRFKPVENVVAEIRALPRAGGLRDKLKPLYVVDDNFISRIKYTKDLLAALAPLHKSGELKNWSAETTLNVAHDEELLDLFQAAGCSTLIIGFESISEATLLDMDKKVNFCLTYQEATERIHQRGMSIIGNFIVGFDTDTLSVFRDILQFCDDNLVLYPFFSILTPMPGTKLHDDFKAAGRLDHFNWQEYDTRHVVYEPKHMTREQLMDGYCWIYEQAYASPRALARLNRFWSKHKRKPSSFVERAFIAWRLRRFRNEGSTRFHNFLRDGWNALKSHPHANLGQLISYLDSAHFTDYLDQFRSTDYARNARIFAGEEEAPERADPSLEKKQWDRKRAAKAGVVAATV